MGGCRIHFVPVPIDPSVRSVPHFNGWIGSWMEKFLVSTPTVKKKPLQSTSVARHGGKYCRPRRRIVETKRFFGSTRYLPNPGPPTNVACTGSIPGNFSTGKRRKSTRGWVLAFRVLPVHRNRVPHKVHSKWTTKNTLLR